MSHMWYYSITFSDSSLISPVCAHTVFERSIDKEWYNPSRTSPNSQGDPLEQSCLGVGNSKTRSLRQQLTTIYCSIFRLQTVAQERERERERERICKGLWTETKRHAPPPFRQNSLNANLSLTIDRQANWLLFQNLLISPVSKIHFFFTFPIKPVPDKIWIHFVYILTFLCWTLQGETIKLSS